MRVGGFAYWSGKYGPGMKEKLEHLQEKGRFCLLVSQIMTQEFEKNLNTSMQICGFADWSVKIWPRNMRKIELLHANWWFCSLVRANMAQGI